MKTNKIVIYEIQISFLMSLRRSDPIREKPLLQWRKRRGANGGPWKISCPQLNIFVLKADSQV